VTGTLRSYLAEQHKQISDALAEETAKPLPDQARIARLRDLQQSVRAELHQQG
jgi:hypothetical protein